MPFQPYNYANFFGYYLVEDKVRSACALSGKDDSADACFDLCRCTLLKRSSPSLTVSTRLYSHLVWAAGTDETHRSSPSAEITVESMTKLAQEIFSRLHITTLVHGNMEKEVRNRL